MKIENGIKNGYLVEMRSPGLFGFVMVDKEQGEITFVKFFKSSPFFSMGHHQEDFVEETPEGMIVELDGLDLHFKIESEGSLSIKLNRGASNFKVSAVPNVMIVAMEAWLKRSFTPVEILDQSER